MQNDLNNRENVEMGNTINFLSNLNNLSAINISSIDSNFYIAESDYCLFDIDLIETMFNDFLLDTSGYSIIFLYFDISQNKFVPLKEQRINDLHDIENIREYFFKSKFSKQVSSRYIIFNNKNSFYALSDEAENSSIFLFTDQFITNLSSNELVTNKNYFIYLNKP